MVSEPLETIIEVTIPADFAGIRLDQALARLLPDWSRSRLQTWIREKRISVDGAAAIPKQKVWSGEKVRGKALQPSRRGYACARADFARYCLRR